MKCALRLDNANFLSTTMERNLQNVQKKEAMMYLGATQKIPGVSVNPVEVSIFAIVAIFKGNLIFCYHMIDTKFINIMFPSFRIHK